MPILLSLVCCFVQPDLHITFTNLKNTQGNIYVAIYNRSDAFLDPQNACFKKIVPANRTAELKILLSDLPPGSYALSCFQDIDGNGVLNKNFFGVPTEPYGFSNNARPRFRAPNWGEANFTLAATGGSIAIKLEKW